MSAIDLSLPPTRRTQRITVMQGEVKVSGDHDVELTTVLGSCVATCLFDPVAKIGGMNHFLLAEPPSGADRATFDEHYGLFLMELLVNEMLKLGSSKDRMKARLYGGANINTALSPIGSANAAFARQFLRDEGIEQSFEDLEGQHARRLHFRPVSGLVRCRNAGAAPEATQKPLVRPQAALGDVELF
ncbi:chemotaxis protein CheD [Qipengyuania sp. DGS5-3]|uniref:chemotaxis protein CheD n=1 Tax=Qipengyuania sp. DGS5-3 TaxID=3349632 RepID=UPI0036D43246